MEELGATMDKHDVTSMTSSISMTIFASIYLDKGSFLRFLKIFSCTELYPVSRQR